MSRPAKKARTEERQEYRIPAEAQAYDRSLHLPQGKNLKVRPYKRFNAPRRISRLKSKLRMWDFDNRTRN